MTTEIEARINELASKLSNLLGVKKELRKLPGLLLEGEWIEHIDRGTYANGNGVVVVTDRRVMFILEGMVKSRVEDFPFERISSVQTEKGMLMGKMTIFASGNKAEVTNMSKSLITEIGDYIRSRIGSAASQTPQAAIPSADQESAIDKLKKLGELRDAGVISEAEFEAKKAELLDQI